MAKKIYDLEEDGTLPRDTIFIMACEAHDDVPKVDWNPGYDLSGGRESSLRVAAKACQKIARNGQSVEIEVRSR